MEGGRAGGCGNPHHALRQSACRSACLDSLLSVNLLSVLRSSNTSLGDSGMLLVVLSEDNEWMSYSISAAQ